jgi:NADH-quinone oxidoreductase subunit L
MRALLWVVPVLPCVSFVILALGGSALSRRWIACIGVGSVTIVTLVAVVIGLDLVIAAPAGDAYIALRLDALAVVMTLVVTFVSLVIHVYSVDFMAGEEGYGRFFAYMNLFVGSMLTLVLADNLLLLYLGWEGVGLCSYLLIGFWYRDPANGQAARKAFIVTRIGDTAMIIGLFLLFDQLGTLQIHDLLQQAQIRWEPGSGIAIAAAALLLGGALGKSAQLPLQTWLPDAMAGPTPVSALIHAATMVTAGVYLIARLHVLFTLAPQVQTAVAAIGAATLLLAGFSALTQRDIKRVLAYSTISQIGYMFLGLGVGAWSAAIFHLMTHAFFKALLFLGAGSIGLALDHTYDMEKMGGLRTSLPVVFWTFLLGAASLAALPVVTAGFYSKDEILWRAWSSHAGGPIFWAAGLCGVFLTSLYTFRMVFLAFFGEAKRPVEWRPGPATVVPLVTLAVLSIVGGFVELPAPVGNAPHFSRFLATALPAAQGHRGGTNVEALMEVVSGVVMLSGVACAWVLFLWRPRYAHDLVATRLGALLHRLSSAGWGFDRAYDLGIVKPYVWLARADPTDVVDRPYAGIGLAMRGAHRA